MSCCAGPITGDVAQASVEATRLHRLNELRASGKALPDGSMHYDLSVPGIHCGQCISTIERVVSRMPGVSKVRVNLSLRRAGITLKDAQQSPLEVVNEIEALGYKVFILEEQAMLQSDREFHSLVKALAVAGFAAANIMLLSVSVWTGADGAARDMFHFISAIIAIPAVAYAGQPFFISAARALRSRQMNMDVPISLGVLLALLMSMYESWNSGSHAYFDAAITLLFFLLIGRTLDYMMRERAREAVTSLGRLSAKGALQLKEDGSLSYLPADELMPGMLLRIPAGERIPTDSRIIEGQSDLDKSLVTGESAPCPVACGQELEAGTLNLTGPLDVEVLRPIGQSFLADIKRMIFAAEQGRGHYTRLADRIARLYAPAVHVLALAAFAGWMLYTSGDWHQSLTVAVAVLIITCPCALGLAVPVAHVVSASRLFKAGILMKDGSALERLAEINHVVFDKTGTLTTGEPRIVKSELPEGKLAAVAKALAERSSHPVARALSKLLPPTRVKLDAIREFPGQGMQGSWNKKTVRLGRADWVASIAKSKTATGGGLAFAIEGGKLYRSEWSEDLREAARETVTTLSAANITSEILSGDAGPAVARLAEAVGIERFSSELRPGDKLSRVEAIIRMGERALMVGDGVNDAPALAAAHVSMAPASASEVGRIASDFVFTRPSLSAVSDAYAIATAARRVVLQNFGLAIAYNVFAVPLAMAGYLSPLIAAVAMSSSSIIVVANSLRLYQGGSSADGRQSSPGVTSVSGYQPALGRLQ